jgi:hypothetical protein
MEPKRLGLLRELVPGVTLIGVLINPNFVQAPVQLRQVEEAARGIGQHISVAKARAVLAGGGSRCRKRRRQTAAFLGIWTADVGRLNKTRLLGMQRACDPQPLAGLPSSGRRNQGAARVL